jgi:hypothetical protein
MLRMVLIVGIALVAAQAGAEVCSASEYAQYKDQARRKNGHHQLALDYCLYRSIAEVRGYGSRAEPCRTEMTKMLDALNATKAPRSIVNWAIDGCVGTAPR